MITKNQIIDAIKAMPEDEFNDVERIIEKIKKGLDAAEKGDVFSEEDMDKLIEQW